MELARVVFQVPLGAVTAILTTAGWSIPDRPDLARSQGLERVLNLIFPISHSGRLDDDPVARAAHSAADALEGTVTFIRPQPDELPEKSA